MNLIKFIKKEITKISFRNKISNVLKKAYEQESNELIIHNNGKLVRDGGSLFKIENEVVDGIYLRRMILNKGASVISGVHKRDHVWFLLQGHITIASENGTEEFVAPYVGFSKAGAQRAIYANENSIFQNVFKNPNDFIDLDDLENYNYCSSIKEFKAYKKNK